VNNYKHGARAKFWLFLTSLRNTESIRNQQAVPKKCNKITVIILICLGTTVDRNPRNKRDSYKNSLRSEVMAAVLLKIQVFQHVRLCRLVNSHRCFDISNSFQGCLTLKINALRCL